MSFIPENANHSVLKEIKADDRYHYHDNIY